MRNRDVTLHLGIARIGSCETLRDAQRFAIGGQRVLMPFAERQHIAVLDQHDREISLQSPIGGIFDDQFLQD